VQGEKLHFLKDKEISSFPEYTPTSHGFSLLEGEAAQPYLKALKIGMFSIPFFKSPIAYLPLRS
jgi:hypothetical protein